MEIKNLESFIQAAELGSFTKAAEKLGYTHSSISLRIKQLEEELGTQLFERINHTVKLTSSGYEMLELAHRIIRTAQEMKKKAAQPELLKGHIRIAAAESISLSLFQRGFDQFRRDFPHISFTVTTASTEEMFRMLNQNEADLVYTLDRHIYDQAYVIAAEEPVACHFTAAAGHPFSLRQDLTLEELILEPFILTEKGMSYRKLLDEFLASRSLSLEPFLELGHTGMICRLLEKGLGISYLPDYATEQSVREGRLVRLRIPDVSIHVWKQLLYHRNKWISRELKAVINYFKSQSSPAALSFL